MYIMYVCMCMCACMGGRVRACAWDVSRHVHVRWGEHYKPVRGESRKEKVSSVEGRREGGKI